MIYTYNLLNICVFDYLLFGCNINTHLILKVDRKNPNSKPGKLEMKEAALRMATGGYFISAPFRSGAENLQRRNVAGQIFPLSRLNFF